MAYNPKAIANEFLWLAESHGQELTPMKIQKLVYYTHGWHLAIKGKPLIDEQVEAWPFGPVIPSLYYAFREFGSEVVLNPGVIYKALPSSTGDEDVEYVEHIPSLKDIPKQAEFVDSLIKRIWHVYGGFTAIQLSNMTHEPGSPWYQIVTKYYGQPPRGTDIPQEVIRDYFVGLASKKTVN